VSSKQPVARQWFLIPSAEDLGSTEACRHAACNQSAMPCRQYLLQNLLFAPTCRDGGGDDDGSEGAGAGPGINPQGGPNFQAISTPAYPMKGDEDNPVYSWHNQFLKVGGCGGGWVWRGSGGGS
jgi:hypothetical protein